MDNFKTGSLVAPDCARVPFISRLPLTSWVFENNVGGLKDLDGKRMRSIFANGFKQSWDEGCANDLEFERLWIGDLDCSLAIVFVIQPLKVFFV